MSIRLISLDCTSCGSALKAGPQDILFICDHCGAGATLGDEGLERVESTALMPRKGRRAQVWRAAWVLETEVVVDQRVRADRRPTPGWSGSRTFWIPAFSLPLNSLTKLARALSTAAGEYGEVPHEPILGGSLSLADALTVARHLVVGDEVR
ncbi:MAG: hypothetical protein GY906_29940, partial [bacterium]|nr:hypothetical protein [bacterium]